jgi:2-polyprenyl-3-methyl-5-hydroxy-6-metoxy-1,4-benzoquinol methylase
MPTALPAWALEMAWVSEGDEGLAPTIDGINLVLNRMRMATFLAEFIDDTDVRDLLTLDVLGTMAGLPISSTGAQETTPSLAMRPFRIWEYVWLYRSLGLSAGGLKVLDLGGPASHLSLLAAFAGCHVTSVDINPVFVQAAHECARALNLTTLDTRVGDMRDLSAFAEDSFDAVVCCSVLEHLTAHDQEVALRETARVLKPGGLAGLTFDFGVGAPGANEHLPPPHDPPTTSTEAVRRYSQGGLVPAGNPFAEDPIPGSLFHHASIGYTVASLFLAKPPAPEVRTPRCERGGSRLGELVIQNLPYRLHKCAKAAMGEVRHTDELIAYKDQLIAQLQTEVGIRDAALDDMRNHPGRVVMERVATAIHDRIGGPLFPKRPGSHAQSTKADQADRPDLK